MPEGVHHLPDEISQKLQESAESQVKQYNAEKMSQTRQSPPTVLGSLWLAAFEGQQPGAFEA